MTQERALLVLLGIIDLERHRLAARVHLGLGSAVRVARYYIHLGRFAVHYLLLLLSGELVGIRIARGGIEIPGHGPWRVTGAVSDRHYCKDQQRRDLNDVDRHGYAGRTGHA